MSVDYLKTAEEIAAKLDSIKPVRDCGPCSLCCKLVPVAEGLFEVPDAAAALDVLRDARPLPETFVKPAGQWCEHCAKPGCKIYERRPNSCRRWSCTWLLDSALPPELEPRKCHVVIDPVTDSILVTPHDGGPTTAKDVVQMWCDPAYPTAWKAPAVRQAMIYYARKFGFLTLVRFNQERGIVVAPPLIAASRDWEYADSNMAMDRTAFIAKLNAVDKQEG